MIAIYERRIISCVLDPTSAGAATRKGNVAAPQNGSVTAFFEPIGYLHCAHGIHDRRYFVNSALIIVQAHRVLGGIVFLRPS